MDSRISASVEGRSDDGEVGLGSETASTTSPSLDIYTSSSLESRANSSSNNAEAGGYFAITILTAGGGDVITALTAGGGDGGGSVLQLKQDAEIILLKHPNSMVNPKR